MLVAAAVLFTVWYSHNIQVSQEKMMLNTFCNMVDTMKQISASYLSGELTDAANWASYVQECLRKISISGNHLLTLINDILEISRVESGKISISPMPFDVREMVSGLESTTRSQAVGHGCNLTCRSMTYPNPA